MSEYIDNVTRRKEILKNVLRQLHAGAPIEGVQAEFGALAQEASSSEIAAVEQMLIDEGLPAEEIQNLCDVHVAVFRAGLDQQRPAESIPGHPVYTFRSENQVAVRMLEEMDRTLARLDENDPAGRQTFAYQLEKLAEIDRHYLRKENLLFPYLEQYGFQGPSKVMWGLHDTIRAKLRTLQARVRSETAAIPQIRAVFDEVSAEIQGMAYKEEKILLPASLEHLKESDWEAIRRQESELGYFFVIPGSEWQPVTVEHLHAETAPSPAETGPQARQNEEVLSLHTGAITLEQVDLILRHLPVDITFVDENDTVRYFSQTRERIFNRTPAIIGRKVQNCHPPQSLARVQQILDDFRAGRRDAADFWIPMGPKFVLIRYYALRDEQGAYKGTLEVTQDIAPLQALRGEKRLLEA
ncbi:MAG TPA: DUF438 domain-containing protein [Anaerolineaceae bacterium]|nr:DUF438 domain-containing protein [Anaerolineaceae bacterium]